MNCKLIWIVTSVFLISTLAVEPAFANASIRCGTHLVTSGGRHGPNKYEVLKKCGEPTIRAGNTWIYELSGGTSRTLVFNASGDLIRIE